MPQHPERWARTKEVFQEAQELPPAEQGAFLERVCAGDAELREEVRSLLAASTDTADFLEDSAFLGAEHLLEEQIVDPLIGSRLGAYQVMREIGRGGMSSVYLAERADAQFAKQVAIKVMRRGVDTSDVLRRFQTERQILASIEHPNIARLLDAGTTSDGLPYFILEHVEGRPITEYASAAQLSIERRLELFRTVCSAVQFAHQRLVIHRDLKPSNILVTADGTVKLLDFGIAKLLSAKGEVAEPLTMTVQRVMTPGYASPEQVRGGPISTGTDVYSLGVLLYELLCGQRPYRLATRTTAEIERAITEQNPPPPSTIAREPHRQQLRGDLDNIVLMAMRKEPERRYGSVEQLSADIHRHLEGLPVSARKDTFHYRAGKFVQRHKVGVLAALLVITTLIGGIIGTTSQARRAERQRARAEQRFDQVRRLANSLVFELYGEIERLPGSTSARHLLVERALEYLDSLARAPGDDPSLQRELISAYIKIGNVQGNPNNANLGETAGALESYREARTLAEQLLAMDPADAKAARQLAVVLEKTSEVQAGMGDLPAAVKTARQSLAGFRSLAEAAPRDPKARVSLAISHQKVGDVLGNVNFPNAGDHAGALENYRAALACLRAAEEIASGEVATTRLVGVMYERLGTIQQSEGDMSAAHESYRESQRIREQLAAAHPRDTNVIRDVAIAHEKIGNMLATAGDLESALASRRRSLAIFQQLADDDPKNVQAQVSLAISHMHLGDLLGSPDAPNLGRTGEALSHYRRATAIFEKREQTGLLTAKSADTLERLRDRISKVGLIDAAERAR